MLFLQRVPTFKASRARAAEMQTNLLGFENGDKGLIQVVADNFDSNVPSQNGLLSTYSLALLLTARDQKDARKTETVIRQLSREELNIWFAQDIQVQRYHK